MTAFAAILRRDLRLALRGGSDALTLILFFVIIGVVVPFAVGPDRELLSRIAPGMVWAATLLAMLLGLDRMFRDDHETGMLLLFRHAAVPLEAAIAAKLLAHWLLSALPLILASPALAMLLAMEFELWRRTVLSLLLGTPALAAFGTLGAAVTVGLRRGGLLAPVLIVPLCVPVLIFGAGAVSGPATGSALLFLSAIGLVATALAPFAAALALRAGGD